MKHFHDIINEEKDMASEIFYDVYIVRLAHTQILYLLGCCCCFVLIKKGNMKKFS